ncbi:MAG: glycoside hydrolase family 19 protein [Burkholderia sp.]
MSPSSSKAASPASPALKRLPFTFPFLRRGRGHSKAPECFTDEHEIYRLLAEHEPSGRYLVSRNGMWHGGIHITEAGMGQVLDLDAGLRCIADGELIAFRVDRAYPVSEIVRNDEPTIQAPYSTGFALVRHAMTFPHGATLTFYSLYMHLMSHEDYAHFPKRDKPSYWPRQWRVTSYARDRPSRARSGKLADPSQQGLRIRSAPNGSPIAILPQGASVILGEKKTVHGREWGRISQLLGASLYPHEADGYVELNYVLGGWVFLGQENGGPVIEAHIADSIFDRVVIATNPASAEPGVAIKAGDLIGHPGRHDSLSASHAGTRMAHVEVFCDDDIQSFIEDGRAWVNRHGAHREDWAELGLPPEATILRIAPGTVLYRRNHDGFFPGANPQIQTTGALQTYSVEALSRDPARCVPELHPVVDPGYPVSWWHVEGVNALGHPIDGWVCDFNFAGGRVTREHAQKWIDFRCLADEHDPTHTIFATAQAWADYVSRADAADIASSSKLSPLMRKVYDSLFTSGDGKHAADELCALSQTDRGGYPWQMQAASRLIVKHESEWANPEKWKILAVELERRGGAKVRHDEEHKRIDALEWWEDVEAGVTGFPDPVVFHINPISLVANFLKSNCISVDRAKALALTITSRFEGFGTMDFEAVADDGDGQGMSFGVIQWAAAQGTLGPVLMRMRSADALAFQACFDKRSDYQALESAMSESSGRDLAAWARDQQTHNPSWKAPFSKLGKNPDFQEIQVDEATKDYHAGVLRCVAFLRSVAPEWMVDVELVTYCALFDLAVQQGSLKKAEKEIKERIAADCPGSQQALIKIAVEERAKRASNASVADCFSRRLGILQQSTVTHSAYGYTKSRANSNFHLISKDAHVHVCGL